MIHGHVQAAIADADARARESRAGPCDHCVAFRIVPTA